MTVREYRPWEAPRGPEGFRFLELNSRRLIWVESSRLESGLSYYLANRLDGVAVDPKRDFKLDSLDALLSFEGLRALVALEAEMVNLACVNELTSLEYLQVSGAPKQPIFTGKLPKLTELRCDWWPGLSIDQRSTQLRSLLIGRYRGKGNLMQFPCPPALEDLEVVQSQIASLEGIERFRNLRRLALKYLPKLTTIAALAGAKARHLETLDFGNCPRIQDHSAVSALSTLRVLRFHACGAIPTLSFTSELPRLEEFGFVGTRVEDGALEPLLRLRRVAFDDKRHYTLKYRQFAIAKPVERE